MFSKPKTGVWAHPPTFGSKQEEAFCRGNGIIRLYTTGCNIPIFVAGRSYGQIKAIKPPHPDFQWHNFFDDDDVLGFPLRPLSASYDALVKDHVIRAGGLGSLTPLSHVNYWKDNDVIRPLVRDLRKII